MSKRHHSHWRGWTFGLGSVSGFAAIAWFSDINLIDELYRYNFVLPECSESESNCERSLSAIRIALFLERLLPFLNFLATILLLTSKSRLSVRAGIVIGSPIFVFHIVYLAYFGEFLVDCALIPPQPGECGSVEELMTGYVRKAGVLIAVNAPMWGWLLHRFVIVRLSRRV